jgi:hypothetical protein
MTLLLSMSGMMHFTSSSLGHGQSTGLLTQSNVAGQRYPEQETITYNVQYMYISSWRYRLTSIHLVSVLRCTSTLLLLLMVLLGWMTEHALKKLELGQGNASEG